MKPALIKRVRCAIYTRVSTEHGLDQEFNSLDAQYDAASAYIKSQAHAGWALIRSRYDDGGYSGGSTDRPDLQRLLDDIRVRKIDVIVVYKVDRLTRSLELLEARISAYDSRAPARGTPAAGNGIFGCGDWRPKIHPRDRYGRQRPETLKIGDKIPAEMGSFRSTTVFAVREDWVVGATGIEPVT